MGYNWWKNRGTGFFDTTGWTLTCSIGGTPYDWSGRNGACGNNLTSGTFYGDGNWHNPSVVGVPGSYTYTVTWWSYNSALFQPFRLVQKYSKNVAALENEATMYLPGYKNAVPHDDIWNRPKWIPTPHIVPIAQPILTGTYPVPEYARNLWGRSLGQGYVNQPGTVRPPIVVPGPVIIPVPIAPGTSLPPQVTPVPGTTPIFTPIPDTAVPPITTPYPTVPVVTVPAAPTYVPAVQNVALAHTAHLYQAPPRGTKEAKVKGVSRSVMVVIGTVTEALDVLDCLHRSLPKTRQINRRKVAVAGKAVYAANRGAQRANAASDPGLVRGFKWERARPVDKFHAVKTNLKYVDLPAAIQCMYEEQILDIAYAQLGKLSGKAAAAARLHGNLPIGFETGYAH